ncbi:MAG: NAD(P)-dependent alcohol dehydrogenase [Methanomassiliicoccales archaeon]|jgi:NADPH:quinone reductase-like Zn-dependent oxidoreductase|nr:NAD(P)-dependent alcohol dehydrogenase [Methanomassiliicoccales archaeon]
MAKSDDEIGKKEGGRMQMKAIICPRYGPPEVLAIRDVEKPIPQDNEVLVGIRATTVVPADIRIRGFRVPPSFWVPARLALGLTRPKKPVLGTEFAGVIEAIGKDVRGFKAGMHVFGLTGHELGCYAEYRCVPEDGLIARKPINLSFEEAAAIPMGGLTAWSFLMKGRVSSGQRVLVYGASGSIGTYAVQLAKHLGAEVTGVCSTANQNMVRSLGADRVIDYTKEDFSKDGRVYDIIFDTVGKSSLRKDMRSLRAGGCLLQAVAPPATNLRMRWAAITTGNKLVGGTMAATPGDLVFLKELAEARRIRPVIDRSYAMERIVDAHRYVDQGHKKGNVVITVGHDQAPPAEKTFLPSLRTSSPTRRG